MWVWAAGVQQGSRSEAPAAWELGAYVSQGAAGGLQVRWDAVGGTSHISSGTAQTQVPQEENPSRSETAWASAVVALIPTPWSVPGRRQTEGAHLSLKRHEAVESSSAPRAWWQCAVSGLLGVK